MNILFDESSSKPSLLISPYPLVGFVSLYEKIRDPSVELSKATVMGDWPKARTILEPAGLNLIAVTLS